MATVTVTKATTEMGWRQKWDVKVDGRLVLRTSKKAAAERRAAIEREKR